MFQQAAKGFAEVEEGFFILFAAVPLSAFI
jgi:hypothetical protein